MKLESIPVDVTHTPAEQAATGMAAAILTEIAQLLEQLAREEAGGAIDLRSLPMSDEERARLEDRLGRGEVSATVDVAGTTEVWETSYTGVWWIRHRGGDGQIAAEEIAVTRVPEILLSPTQDIRATAARIVVETNPAEPGTSEEEPLHV